jgi:hypothetical protein
VPIREPASLILGAADVGSARTGGADHVSAGEAAHLEQNQPLSLTRYERWGWIDEATADFGAAPHAVHLDLLLLSRDEGAELAYAAWQTGGVACPADIAADDCSIDPGRQLVARVGPYVFRIATAGDASLLAMKQAARIRSGSAEARLGQAAVRICSASASITGVGTPWARPSRTIGSTR